MFGEILKFGAQIVDNLRTYKHPVFAYIPPNGELRGGAWVVIDPTINEEMMEMYVDTNARGGILEPPGICDVKFRKPDLIKTMHRLDSTLISLDEELTAAEETMVDDVSALKKAIAARESQLMPLYVQISHEFADLHDRPGRMKAKGVIRDIVPWARAREYFHWRVRRRLMQDALVGELKAADGSLSHGECLTMLSGWMAGKASWEDDKAVLAFFESEGAVIDEKLGEVSAFSTPRFLPPRHALSLLLTPPFLLPSPIFRSRRSPSRRPSRLFSTAFRRRRRRICSSPCKLSVGHVSVPSNEQCLRARVLNR